MTFRDRLLPRLERIRGIPAKLGHRVYTVAAITMVTWSGARIGLGTRTATSVSLTVAFGKYPPKVRQLSQEDIVRSGGAFDKSQFEIGPLTPGFAGGGFTPAQLDPSVSSAPTQVFVKLIGPGTDPNGDWFVKISDSLDRPYHYKIRVEKTAERPE